VIGSKAVKTGATNLVPSFAILCLKRCHAVRAYLQHNITVIGFVTDENPAKTSTNLVCLAVGTLVGGVCQRQQERGGRGEVALRSSDHVALLVGAAYSYTSGFMVLASRCFEPTSRYVVASNAMLVHAS
jgi:hypothetical protein